jgi:tetratricopeptide (TPR) repeat protein
MADFKALREARKFTSQGRAEELAGNADLAIQNYNSAIEKYPSMVEARVYLAFLEWTKAGCQDDISKVERTLNEAIDHFSKASSPQEIESGKVAVTKRMLLLCQEGREQEAATHLTAAGFEYRLSKDILSYAMFNGESLGLDGTQSSSSFVAVRDDVLTPSMFSHLQSTFRRDGPFWSEHSYNTEQSGYFSYLHKLDGAPSNNIEQIIHHLWRSAIASFPAAAEARFAEWCGILPPFSINDRLILILDKLPSLPVFRSFQNLNPMPTKLSAPWLQLPTQPNNTALFRWAHCRPHCSGHQLHFDSGNLSLSPFRSHPPSLPPSLSLSSTLSVPLSLYLSHTHSLTLTLTLSLSLDLSIFISLPPSLPALLFP